LKELDGFEAKNSVLEEIKKPPFKVIKNFTSDLEENKKPPLKAIEYLTCSCILVMENIQT